jgi:hypothetical protein
VDVTDITDKERANALQEIMLLAMLRHPAIISYHEVGAIGNIWFGSLP